MKVFIAIELSFEPGPGSEPIVDVHPFSSVEKREEFVAEWNREKALTCFESGENEWLSQGWSYRLDLVDKKIDK